MKRLLYKFTVVLLIILVLYNYFLGCFEVSYAFSFQEALNDLLGSVIGIFTWVPKVLAMTLARGLQTIVGVVAYSQGKVENGNIVASGDLFSTGVSGELTALAEESEITPFDIFFNKIAILDINFFNFNIKKPDGSVDTNHIVYKIRSSIATWYYVLRSISVAILLVVLIYIGIRMALSTVAKEKALYNKMLIDWVCSLALVFLLHYIALFAINANDALLKMLEGVAGGDTGEKMRTTVMTIRSKAIWGIDMDSLAAAVVYCMFVAQTLALFIAYFMRMLKLAFLLIIAPLITLTYSIDKIGDGKAQALGNWLKEFVYTILIQPFHCIIYLCFVSMAFGIIDNPSNYENNTVTGLIFAILCLRFTKEAEKIIRKIFGFKDDNAGTSLAAGMAMSAAALGSAKKIGKGTRSAFNGAKNFGNKMSDMSMGLRAGVMAMHASKGDNNGEEQKSFADRKADAREKLESERAIRSEMKALKKDNRHRGVSNGARKDVAEAYEKIKEDSKNTGEKLTHSQMMARARLAVAQENRSKARAANGDKDPEIKGVRGQIQKMSKAIGDSKVGKVLKDVKDFAGQSETLRELSKMSVAMGAGMFMGSAVYGTGANASTAITAGLAAHRGVSEFMGTSTKTIAREVGNGLRSLNVSSKDDANDKLDGIMEKGNNEEYNERVARELFNSIEEQLKAANLSSDGVTKAKASIRTTIEKAAKENNGESMDNIIKRAIDSAKGEVSTSDAQKLENARTDGDMISSLEEFTSFKVESNIFKNMQNATAVGLDTNVLAGAVERQFHADYTYINGESSEPENANPSESGSEGEENVPIRTEDEPSEEPAGNEEPTPTPSENENGDDNAEPELLDPNDDLMFATVEELKEMQKQQITERAKYEKEIKQLKDELKKITDSKVAKELETKINDSYRKMFAFNANLSNIREEMTRRGISND